MPPSPPAPAPPLPPFPPQVRDGVLIGATCWATAINRSIIHGAHRWCMASGWWGLRFLVPQRGIILPMTGLSIMSSVTFTPIRPAPPTPPFVPTMMSVTTAWTGVTLIVLARQIKAARNCLDNGDCPCCFLLLPFFWVHIFYSFSNKSKLLASTVSIFIKRSDLLSRTTDRVPGSPVFPEYVQWRNAAIFLPPHCSDSTWRAASTTRRIFATAVGTCANNQFYRLTATTP